MKEYQKIKYLEIIKNKDLSIIDDPNFLQRLEIASLLDTHNNTENSTSLNE
jgi:hypothetical protein